MSNDHRSASLKIMGIERSRGVVVVGSANMDIVFSVERIPRPGETVLSRSVSHHPGGKGLNQAVAAARAGASTAFVGALGVDPFGDSLAEVMTAVGIDQSLLRRVEADTGQAFIVVDQAAENMIVVASGANAAMSMLTGPELAVVEASRVLLMQLELPSEAVRQAAIAARAAGVTTMLNAAPASAVDNELLSLLDFLIVNEHEACQIAGVDDLAVAAGLLSRRVDRLIVTLGSEGSAVYEGGVQVGTVTPPPVVAVDTTGAGDTFCGALAAAISEGQELLAAVRFATAAAALSVQRPGAVASIPARPEIELKVNESW